MNIIQILKFPRKTNNELITTLRFQLGNLYVNNKMTKQPTILGAISLMEIILSKP
jgi:hypothetical protein